MYLSLYILKLIHTFQDAYYYKTLQITFKQQTRLENK